MGLDNFWELPEGADEPTFEKELRLCGGMFSGHGQGSFRGKVYADLVEAITGVSLYTEKIDNETVREMAQKLAETTYEEALEHDSWTMFSPEVWYNEDTEEEYYAFEEDPEYPNHEECKERWKDFQTMFMTYAEAGAELTSWW